MARGQAKAADQQRALSNAQGGTEFGNAQNLYNTLNPSLQDQLKNPGYSAADKTSITNNTLGGIGSSYDAANQSNTNRVARTHNSAGSTELADELARDRGRTTATAEAGLGEKFADTALQQKNAAQQQLGQLYGINTNAGTSLYGQGPGALEARAAGQSEFGQILGAAGQVGAAFAGGRNK